MFVIAGIAKAASSPGSAQAIFTLGDPTSTGIGAYMASGGASLHLLAFNIAADFATTVTTEFLFFTILDLTNNVAHGWINGVALADVALTGNTTRTR